MKSILRVGVGVKKRLKNVQVLLAERLTMDLNGLGFSVLLRPLKHWFWGQRKPVTKSFCEEQ